MALATTRGPPRTPHPNLFGVFRVHPDYPVLYHPHNKRYPCILAYTDISNPRLAIWIMFTTDAHDVHAFLDHHWEQSLLLNDACLYSQHIQGTNNGITDFIHTNLQVHPSFTLYPIRYETVSWLTSNMLSKPKPLEWSTLLNWWNTKYLFFNSADLLYSWAFVTCLTSTFANPFAAPVMTQNANLFYDWDWNPPYAVVSWASSHTASTKTLVHASDHWRYWFFLFWPWISPCHSLLPYCWMKSSSS